MPPGNSFRKAFGGFGSKRREILYWRAAGPPKRLSADFALSAEPSYGKLIIGAVGKVLIQGDFIGKRAHGSEPQNGINAISEAAVLTAHLNQPPPACSAAEPQPYVPFVFKEEKLHIPQIFQIIAPYSSISTLFR